MRRREPGWLLAAAMMGGSLGGLLGGCGTSLTPAPIVHRTTVPRAEAPAAQAGAGQLPVPGPSVATPSQGVVVTPLGGNGAAAGSPAAAGASPGASPGAPPASPAPAEPAVQVQSAPQRGGLEVRPLQPGPAANAIGQSSAPAAAPLGNLRTSPSGLKRPWSAAAVAELESQAMPAPAATAAPASPPAAAAPAAAAPPASAASVPPASAASAGGSSFIWPVKGKVSQSFSEPGSAGVVIDAGLGDPVVAAAEGRVIFSGPGPRGYGNLLIVKHQGDTVSVYAHNKALLVKQGDTVKRGQRIAEVGDAVIGRPHLLFEIRRQGKPIDPEKVLPHR